MTQYALDFERSWRALAGASHVPATAARCVVTLLALGYGVAPDCLQHRVLVGTLPQARRRRSILGFEHPLSRACTVLLAGALGGKERLPTSTVEDVAKLLAAHPLMPSEADAEGLVATVGNRRSWGRHCQHFLTLVSGRQPLSGHDLIRRYWADLNIAFPTVEALLQELGAECEVPGGYLRPQDMLRIHDDDLYMDVVGLALRRVPLPDLRHAGAPRRNRRARMPTAPERRLEPWPIDPLITLSVDDFVRYVVDLAGADGGSGD
ncbi:MAG: hypothetical protein ABFE16_16195 [Armatimonadia bacterium]